METKEPGHMFLQLVGRRGKSAAMWCGNMDGASMDVWVYVGEHAYMGDLQ